MPDGPTRCVTSFHNSLHAVFDIFFLGFVFGINVFPPTTVMLVFFAVALVPLVTFVRLWSSLPLAAYYVLLLSGVFFDTDKLSQKVGPFVAQPRLAHSVSTDPWGSGSPT